MSAIRSQRGDVKIHVVPAMHSSEPSGRPVGYVLEFGEGERYTMKRYLDLWRHVIDPGILSSQHHLDGMRPVPTDNMRAWPGWR